MKGQRGGVKGRSRSSTPRSSNASGHEELKVSLMLVNKENHYSNSKINQTVMSEFNSFHRPGGAAVVPNHRRHVRVPELRERLVQFLIRK